MKLKQILLAASGAAVLVVPSYGATLVDWTFTGNDPAVSNDPNVPGAIVENQSADGVIVADSASYATTLGGVTSSNLTGFDGAMFSLGTSGGDPVYQNELNLRGFASPIASGGTSIGGYEFTVAATSGTINVTGFDIDLWRNGAGAPNIFFVEANVDGGGFTQFGTNSTEPISGDKTFRTHSFTGDVTGSSIVFRIRATGNSGNVHVNDIQVTGDLVPEPSSTALLGLGGLAFVLRRKR